MQRRKWSSKDKLTIVIRRVEGDSSPGGNGFIAISARMSHPFALGRVCRFALAGDLNNGCKMGLSDFAIWQLVSELLRRP
jgi:hypothetical protein